MAEERQITMLCVAGFKKGDEFIREAKRQGCFVILLTILNKALCSHQVTWGTCQF